MRVSKGRVAATAVGALALAAGVAAPAQAYSPDPEVNKAYYDTDDCFNPFACFDRDPDGGEATTFQYDKNGVATKMEMIYKGKFVGKVEFHPYSERVCIYDERGDNDTFYLTVAWINDNGYQCRTYHRPGLYPCRNLSITDGTLVDVAVYDNGYSKDLIGRTLGTA